MYEVQGMASEYKLALLNLAAASMEPGETRMSGFRIRIASSRAARMPSFTPRAYPRFRPGLRIRTLQGTPATASSSGSPELFTIRSSRTGSGRAARREARSRSSAGRLR